jgi:PadR family transcriptional regulator PadR
MITSTGSGLTELRRGVVEYCVLALLAERERYGLELVRTLASLDGLVTSEGTVYPLLNRLRNSGLVTTMWRQEGDDRPRKYYTLTSSGERALEQFRRDWARFRSVVDRVIDVKVEDRA